MGTRLRQNTQLDEAHKRLSKTRDLLLAGNIEADDYRLIKSESEEKINRLEAQLTASVTDTTNIEPLWNHKGERSIEAYVAVDKTLKGKKWDKSDVF